MGNVFFNTDVDKTVDITKNVNLDVNKFVDADVDIFGHLATAEASADAIGGGGNGPATCEQLSFIIDDYSDDQQVLAGPLSTVTGVAPGVIIPPDGATFNATDIPNGVRTITVENFTDAVNANTTINAGGVDSALFSNDQETNSNQSLSYTSEDGPYSILIDCEPPGEIDLTDIVDDNGDPTNSIIFNNVSATAENGTIRIEATITDAQGDSATLAGYGASLEFALDNGVNEFVDGQDIIIPLGLFTGDIPIIPVDTELSSVIPFPGTGVGFYSAGGELNFVGDGELNLDQVVSFDLSILGNEADFTIPIPADGLEDPTTDAWDIDIDLIEIASECCTPGDGGGTLAETDTFAQATEEGSFSFSEALAAVSGGEVDNLIT